MAIGTEQLRLIFKRTSTLGLWLMQERERLVSTAWEDGSWKRDVKRISVASREQP
jgi:hypothetical protein